MYTLMYRHPKCWEEEEQEDLNHVHIPAIRAWMNGLMTCLTHVGEMTCICACYYHINHHSISSFFQFTNLTWNHVVRI